MKHFRIAYFLLAATLLFTACKKDKDEETAASITGTWNITQVGFDNNNNNQVEDTELIGSAAAGFSGTFTFNANNTFTATTRYQGQTDTESGTYTYSNNLIKTTSGGTTDSLYVKSLTATKLTLSDQNTAGGSWIVMTK